MEMVPKTSAANLPAVPEVPGDVPDAARRSPKASNEERAEPEEKLQPNAAAAVSTAPPVAEQLSAGHSGCSGAGELQRRIERGGVAMWLSLAQCRGMETSNEGYPKVPEDFTITDP